MAMEDWKQLLKKMKLRHIEEKSPGFYKLSGSEKMKLNPYSDDNTTALTNSVYDFLRFSKCYVNRINSTGTPRMIDGKLKFTHSATRKGTADLDSIFPGGIPVKLEIKCKATADKLSKEQLAEKKRIEDVGGYYIVVPDFPTFLKWYEAFTGITDHLKTETAQ